ncbi:MAG: SCO family protein [Proteobacteria bacterium]|nr:SCO family protein [Pseudomonadota bacterium]
MRSRKLFIASVAIIAMLTGAWLSYRLLVPPPMPRTATVFPAPAELPEFSLLDQYGKPFDRQAFAGEWSLVFFGFTHCPDICPLTLQVLASARKELSDAGHEPLPRIIFISVDPERDTADVIGQYVAHFSDDIVAIRGELDELRKLTSGLGIFFEKSPVDSDDYSVDHSSAVLVINPQGQFHALFSAPHKAGNFSHDLPIIMSSR